MKRRLLSTVTVFIVALLAVPTATAGDDSRWYLGLGAGSSDHDFFLDADTGFKIFGGFEFNEYIAVEGAFVDLGVIFSGLYEEYVFSIQAVFSLPLGEKFKLYGKAGFYRWEELVLFVDGDSGTDSTFGIGGQWAFAEHWAARIEHERFNDLADSDVDMTSICVLYRF